MRQRDPLGVLNMPARGVNRIDCYRNDPQNCPGRIDARQRCVRRGNHRIRAGYGPDFDRVLGRRGTYTQRYERWRPRNLVHLRPADRDHYYDTSTESESEDSDSDESE